MNNRKRTNHQNLRRLLSAFAISTLLLHGAVAEQPEAEQPEAEQWQQGQAIMQRVDSRPQPDTEISMLQMQLTDQRGRQRTRQLKLFTHNDGAHTSTLLFFTAPADVRGVGLLTIAATGEDSDQWLYMPALRRTRRIAGSGRQDSFMGSDFSYEDLESPDITRSQYRLTGEESMNGRPCYVIEAIPQDTDSSYSKRLSWIDTESLIALRVDFFTDSNDPVKRLTADGISRHNGYWRADTLRMEDLARGRHTVLHVSEQEFDIELPSNLFSVRTLENGRIP